MGYALKMKNVGFSDVAVDRVTYVIPVPCEGVSLNKDTLTFESVGETDTLVATLTPYDTTDSVIWASSDDAVASVADGVVTIHGIGSATITVTCGNYSASASIAQTSIKPYGGSKTVDGKIASEQNGIIKITSTAGQSTVGQEYSADTVSLHAQGGDTSNVQLIPVPYGATKCKFMTNDGTAIVINFAYTADTSDLAIVDGKQYPKVDGSYTSVVSTNGLDVEYGQCVIFRVLNERLTKFSYVYFT